MLPQDAWLSMLDFLSHISTGGSTHKVPVIYSKQALLHVQSAGKETSDFLL